MPPLNEGRPLQDQAERSDARDPVLQWMSLDEKRDGVARSGEFSAVSFSEPGMDRREFLQIASAAAAVVGLGGCFRQPPEQLMPYAKRPADGVAGLPLHFATGLERGGITVGLVAECREHHPIKLEGNPAHPGSLGATGPVEQASLLGLYDPTRARVFRLRGQPASREAFQAALQEIAIRRDSGRGLRFLVEPTASPSLAQAYRRLLERFPEARFVQFAPAESDSVQRGAELAYGQRFTRIPSLGSARVVVSLDCDFLSVTPRTLRPSHDFVAARRPERMNRLYTVESNLSLTGAFADHRLRVRPSQISSVARAIALAVGKGVGRTSLGRVATGDGLSGEQSRWAEVVARDLVAHQGECLFLVGDRQAPQMHALGHLINEALGNVGKTVELREPVVGTPPGMLEFDELVREMTAGEVDTLIITAWNPAFAAFADSAFKAALEKVKTSVYLTLHEDETSDRCTWVVPAQHPFESWRDGRAFDGTASILQPLLAPVFKNTMAVWELLGPFLGNDQPDAYGYLRAFWQTFMGAPSNFAELWKGWLAEGVIPDTALKPVQATLREERVVQSLEVVPPTSEGMEINFLVDTRVHDGRYGTNAWLQELPDPMTQLTWGNAALASPATALELGLASGQWATLTYRGRSIETPILVLPGHADGTVSLAIGYGAVSKGGGEKIGVNAFALRCGDAPWSDKGLVVKPLARREELTLAQEHWRMYGRELALQRHASTFKPSELEPLRREREEFYPPEEPNPPTHRWAMAIDLNRCIGCSACVVACQAENNIPAVGKKQVRLGREMHWLRIDRYFMGEEADPGVITQPVACVHCERAPCEYVCPVNATVHSDEGLNQMVYNRCIGTRYCSNNCPYKVRRFNYLNYTKSSPLELMVRNPEVTVRGRGVMEKCTYCVQRIERARIQARVENRPIRDGEVRTACQQACPTQAIVFGDLSQPESHAALAHQDGRRYELLHELGTQPRTVHLVRLKNPNPELT